MKFQLFLALCGLTIGNFIFMWFTNSLDFSVLLDRFYWQAVATFAIGISFSISREKSK